MSNYEYLVGRVAEHLAGRPVSVRYRRPHIHGAVGLAMKTNAGAVIDVDPWQPFADQYGVFLHEVAHIKSSYAIMPDESSMVHLPPGSTRFISTAAEAEHDRQNHFIESQADQLAGKWLGYADRNAVYFRGDWLSTRLQALLTF